MSELDKIMEDHKREMEEYKKELNEKFNKEFSEEFPEFKDILEMYY